MKREMRRKPCEFKNGEVILKSSNLILKLFRYRPENKKLVLEAGDNKARAKEEYTKE